MTLFYRCGNRDTERFNACLRSHSLDTTELTFQPREEQAESRLGRRQEGSGGLRGRRETGQIGWVVPARNRAGVHMELAVEENACVLFCRERNRFREGQLVSEVTQCREVEPSGPLAEAWLLGQDSLTLAMKSQLVVPLPGSHPRLP